MDKETYVSEIKSGLKGLPEGEAMIEEIESHIEHHLFRSFQEGLLCRRLLHFCVFLMHWCCCRSINLSCGVLSFRMASA